MVDKYLKQGIAWISTVVLGLVFILLSEAQIFPSQERQVYLGLGIVVIVLGILIMVETLRRALKHTK